MNVCVKCQPDYEFKDMAEENDHKMSVISDFITMQALSIVHGRERGPKVYEERGGVWHVNLSDLDE